MWPGSLPGVGRLSACCFVDREKIGTGWIRGKIAPGFPPREEAVAMTFVNLNQERRFKSGGSKA